MNSVTFVFEAATKIEFLLWLSELQRAAELCD